MSKHEAVDRLMALATEKRADRIPDTPPALTAIEEPSSTVTILPAAASSLTAHPGSQAGTTAADRGRQLLQAIRPLLPAVAGAMRMVDHGAVQALARLLPLLSAGAGPQLPPSLGAEQEKAHEEQLRTANDLQSAHQAIRKDVHALTLQLATSDDLLGRTRSQLERLAAEQTARDSDLRALGDRVRLLSAGLIILLMLVVVQMILFIVVLHR
jgi:hypothetical protein